VHVSTFEGDDETFGVGMAVIALFSVAPTDAAAFEKAATVAVNGKPATGSWFWQDSTVPGYPTEALYREKDFWPAHSTIDVNLPVKGLSAGTGLQYDDSLTLTFTIGAAHVSHVDNAQHMMTVTSDDKVVKNVPISLGYANTPTYDGVKVVMGKGSVKPGTHTPLPNGTVEMKSDPGESPSYDLMVPWSVRITNSGEFVHAASWNGKNIGSVNTSHGCTNLNPADAEWFYNFSVLGDVVDYPDANPAGTVQPSWDGWGWWNVPWSEWTRGGQLATA
jgi:lipoprotein-anchoring transpeptidase ErfK/SrfK